jgi:hypothetical protein
MVFNSRRFGTLCLFHLHRQVAASTCLWRWHRQSVPKRRILNTIRRRTTQKVTHDIQNTAKAWNREWFLPFIKQLFMHISHIHLISKFSTDGYADIYCILRRLSMCLYFMRNVCIHRERIHVNLVVPYALIDVATPFPSVSNISCYVSYLSSHCTGRYAWIAMRVLRECDGMPEDNENLMLLRMYPAF